MAEYKGWTVLLVDDHKLIREALRQRLRAVPQFFDLYEAEDGTSAVAEAARLNPDLVIMDLNLPGMDGIEAIKRVLNRSRNIRIIALTAYVSEAKAAEVLSAGAAGYLSKSSDTSLLSKAIQCVMAGRSYIDPVVNADQVTALMLNQKRGDGRGLTAREREVLKLIAAGNKNKEIAEMLFVSLKTVETHRLRLMQKLDAHNGADLTRWAYRLGLTQE